MRNANGKYGPICPFGIVLSETSCLTRCCPHPHSGTGPISETVSGVGSNRDMVTKMVIASVQKSNVYCNRLRKKIRRTLPWTNGFEVDGPGRKRNWSPFVAVGELAQLINDTPEYNCFPAVVNRPNRPAETELSVQLHMPKMGSIVKGKDAIFVTI